MSLAELSAWQWAIVAAAGLLAGFVNTVAGGGSLLTLPALMLAGLPPTVANGTNRIGILMQSSSASLQFQRAGSLDLSLAGRLLWPTLVGAGLGAYTASILSDEAMEPIIFGVLVTVAGLFALKPEWVAPQPDPQRIPQSPGLFTTVMLLVTGFYGGFLQAGVGFLLLTVLAGTLRIDLTRANALKVAIVIPYTILALGIFAWADQVVWGVGVLLGATSMIGARFGVYVALERADWLRWLVLGAVVASGVAMAARRLA